MAKFPFLLIVAYIVVADARLDMTFYSELAKISAGDTQRIYCVDSDATADGDISQVFGRVLDTGAGSTGNGASGPSYYGTGSPSSVSAPAGSGLPSVTDVVNDQSHPGHYLWMKSDSNTVAEHIGIFYCDTETTDDGTTRIQFIQLLANAHVVPLKRSVTINFGESVTLEMNMATSGSSALHWRHDTVYFDKCDDQLSCEVSSAGVYECYYNGNRDNGVHAITRVIIRDCPAEMWYPLSGCDKVCVECINGGVCDDEIGDCVCPPGFHGTHCELTCNSFYFGPTCGLDLASSNRYFCLPDPYGCSCASGWQGADCTLECDGYHFGADCALKCHCATGECDQYTGECDSGECAAGWSGHNCQYISSTVLSFTDVKVISGEQTTFTCVIQAYPRPLESQVSLTLGLSGPAISVEYAIDPNNHTVILRSSNVSVTTGEEYYCGVTSGAVAGGINQSNHNNFSS